jgi:tetratricopeptide (TPR) repeat protein
MNPVPRRRNMPRPGLRPGSHPGAPHNPGRPGRQAGRSATRVWLAGVLILCGWLLARPGAATAQSPLAGKLINFQGQVAVARGGGQNWGKAEVNQDLFVGDAVQTGPDSRAAILCVDESQLKLNENTVLVLKNVAPSPRLGMAAVQPAKAGEAPGSLYQVQQGEMWLRNNKEKFPFAVETPAVTAAIRGTEFNLRVQRDGASYLTLLGGSLKLFNDYGQITLSPGEEGMARPGQAPTKRIVLQPADAVQWSLYYPGIFSFRDLPLTVATPAAVPGTARSRQAADLAAQAEANYDRGRLGQARADADSALQLEPAEARALTVRGWLSLQHQDPQAAEQFFRQVRLPSDSTAVGLALARYRLGDVIGALRLLQEAHRRQPGSPLLATMYGYMALMAGKVQEATATIEAVVRQWPHHTLARCLLAQIYLVQNHKDRARTEAAAALRQAPASPLAHLTVALADITYFDLPAASRQLQEALAADPRFVTAYVYLAKIQLGGNYLNRALATIQSALRLAPREAPVLTLAGFIRLAFRDYQ